MRVVSDTVSHSFLQLQLAVFPPPVLPSDCRGAPPLSGNKSTSVSSYNYVKRPLCPRNHTDNVTIFCLSTGNISTVKVELPSPSPTTSHTGTPSPPTSLSATAPQASSTSTSSSAALPQSLSPSSLLTQMSSLGPTDRCTPSQAQAMGQQVLAVIALHEKNTLQLPREPSLLLFSLPPLLLNPLLSFLSSLFVSSSLSSFSLSPLPIYSLPSHSALCEK